MLFSYFVHIRFFSLPPSRTAHLSACHTPDGLGCVKLLSEHRCTNSVIFAEYPRRIFVRGKMNSRSYPSLVSILTTPSFWIRRCFIFTSSLASTMSYRVLTYSTRRSPDLLVEKFQRCFRILNRIPIRWVTIRIFLSLIAE